jgi:hypothetical protein
MDKNGERKMTRLISEAGDPAEATFKRRLARSRVMLGIISPLTLLSAN